jgi:diadenosine tetraphosphatase ApaH/serine/threonine PP2A family protein phosphatase
MGWLRPKRKVEAPLAAWAPEGEVVYAIGDIHGRADLLGLLLRAIEDDAATRSDLRMRLVTLGDYIDRGPDSRGVIDLLIELQRRHPGRITTLRGNHEEAMLDFLHEPETGASWCEFGGREALLSYGVIAPRGRKREDWAAARDALRAVLPLEHLRFLTDLEVYAQFGDYVFVHAGLKPKVPLEQQDPADLLWIREEFLDARPWSSQVVVHGHTPATEPMEAPGRIGVDTGAYATSLLTAVRLEGDRRRFIQARA